MLASALALAAVLCLLGQAGAARAAEYTVNSTGDQADAAVASNGCKTAVATCTLRAAIEESNASTEVDDTIDFAPFFDGGITDTIELGTSLPTITDRVRVAGFPSPQQCETDYFGVPGPCVGVHGPAGGTAFRVEAERVVLIGFAITGADTAIEAVGAPGLDAWNDWLGVKLDGSAGPVGTGISVDQSSNGPLIGGASSVARMIFAHNTETGLDIEGADAAVVRGSGFGVLPDGNTPAPNGTNIEITDAASGENRVARFNWIGGTLSAAQLASPVCDGACNVIAAASGPGIDLAGDGDKPASGSTRIFGNYIGLNAFGTAGLPNALQGVRVGSAENVTIGGANPGDRNMINGGIAGVAAGKNAGNLRIEHNWIGLDPTGTEMLAPPTSAGISVESGFQTDIARNRISMLSGTAIVQSEREAVIRANAIGEGVNGEDLPGGAIGIHLSSGSCFLCGLIYDNSIANAAEYGVLIEGSRNAVYGNRIEGSGEAGIRIEGPPPGGFATRNVIGGDVAAEENTISLSGGAAIEIAEVVEFGATRANIVARNNGELNGGPFIDLLNGAQEEIPAPSFSSSTPSGAAGAGAAPGAVIRVFRKASASPGEIESFLTETVADGEGSWAVTYPSPLPGGTVVAASQTTEEEGTSELAFATTATEPSGGDGEGDGGSGGGGPIIPPPPPPVPDTTPPQTFIVKGPGKDSRSGIARFRFGSSEPASRFRCRLDRGLIRDCRSPRTYRRLKAGKHVFRVWATDAAGNRDASPAKWVFRVRSR